MSEPGARSAAILKRSDRLSYQRICIAGFTIGTAWGIWRYRQEMHRPAEPVGADRA